MEPLAESTGRDTSPLVSIVLPSYNGARTIRITLDSIAAQDYRTLEWIVVDDASTDGTPQIVEDLLKSRSPTGRLMRHGSNQGLARTLNDGLAAAHGDLVLIVHQDVAPMTPDWIRRATKILSEDRTVAAVTCYYGLPASDDMTFVKRAFGFLRRQFLLPSQRDRVFVTFTEFKCDLVRKSLPARMARLCGPDRRAVCVLHAPALARVSSRPSELAQGCRRNPCGVVAGSPIRLRLLARNLGRTRTQCGRSALVRW